MQVIVVKNQQQLSQTAAQILVQTVQAKPHAVLGLPTGGTSKPVYQAVVKAYQQKQLSLALVKTFNLDEYMGLPADHPQSYRSFMQKHLFSQTDIQLSNTHFPVVESGVKGGVEHATEMARIYEDKIQQAGGIDLQILGLGSNGHIGFNEPTSSLSSRTRLKTLTQRTLKDNQRFFDKHEFQPNLALTMGIGTIMDARKIVILASGNHKANAVATAIEGPIAATCPATALQQHARVKFIVDLAAAAQLKLTDYYLYTQQLAEEVESLGG